MISAGDFKNGLTIEIDGTVFQIIEFQHVKPGKGAAFVRTKLKNVVEYPQAHIDKKEMQYLYAEGDMYNFMDMETYDQIALADDAIGDAMKFVKENDMVKMVSYKGNIFSVEPPMFAELEVTETEPGVKGDTATNVTKPATVETGAQVNVPIFVNQGDVIQIDTRTGEYLKRI